MKRSSLQMRWLGMGLACSVIASASVALGQTGIPYPASSGLPTGVTQAILWTFDSGVSGWGSDGYSNLSGFVPTYVSSDSSLYSPAGAFGAGSADFSGELGPGATTSSNPTSWSRSHPGYNGTGWFTQWNQNPADYNAFIFDYNLPTSTPLDSNGNVPTFRFWLQFGAGGATPNTNNNGGSVPYDLSLIPDGQWHTAVIYAGNVEVSDGSGNYTSPTWDPNLVYLHDLSIGVADGNYTTATTINLGIDNIGFATIVPEPSSLALLGLGALGLGMITTYRRKFAK